MKKQDIEPLLLVGDIHAKTGPFYSLLKKHKFPPSIQLGDFGFSTAHNWHRKHLNPERNKVLWGNHDDPRFLTHPHSLGDYGFEPTRSLFWVRGADSIDRADRTQGIDWWPQEELTYNALRSAIDLYEDSKPQIVISHDCPQRVRAEFFGIREASRTSTALDAMLDLHQPDLWVFGHHHRSMNQMVGNTRFVCLKELEAYWI